VKNLLLSCLFAFSCQAVATAQQLKAPEALRSTTVPTVPAEPKAPSTTEVEKLAEEAQKSLYQTVDKGTAGTTTTKGLSSTGFALPFKRPEDPSRWDKDSVRKIAVMEVAFGGVRDTVMIELFPGDAPQTVANFINLCDSGFLQRPSPSIGPSRVSSSRPAIR
jgi:hypothetical protein